MASLVLDRGKQRSTCEADRVRSTGSGGINFKEKIAFFVEAILIDVPSVIFVPNASQPDIGV